MSETQYYKTVTFTPLQAGAVEAALRMRVGLITAQIDLADSSGELRLYAAQLAVIESALTALVLP